MSTPTGMAASMRGLPVLERTPVETPHLIKAEAQSRLIARGRSCATFSGPSGSGKTTAAITVADSMACRFIYCDLIIHAGAGAVLRHAFSELYPGRPHGRLRLDDLKREIIDRLVEDDIGIIADEVHRAQLQALLMLAMLWSGVARRRGHGFPLMTVGVSARDVVDRVPELATRSQIKVAFDLLHGQQLRDVLHRLSPRCANTDWSLLRAVDATYGRGNLSHWTLLIDMLEGVGAPQGSAVTVADVRAALDALGHDPVGLPDA